MEAWPPERCGQDISTAIRDLFGIGAKRSALQDLRFIIDELVEIAARALSPGVNDPFTAITCLDWLGPLCPNLPSARCRRTSGLMKIVRCVSSLNRKPSSASWISHWVR